MAAIPREPFGSNEASVWLFHADSPGTFACAVFSTIETADEWIARVGASGTLTRYPLDVSVYDWVIAEGYWTPKRDDQRTPEFIQRFTSAYTGHHHYEGGRRNG
jgi:hypothetical protein